MEYSVHCHILLYTLLYATIRHVFTILRNILSIGKQVLAAKVERSEGGWSPRVVLQIWYRTSGNYGHLYTASTVCNAPLLRCTVYMVLYIWYFIVNFSVAVNG